MKHYTYYIYIGLATLLLTMAGCSKNDDDTVPMGDTAIETDVFFAVSTPSAMGTRMASSIVQEGGLSDFRGITDTRIVPFSTGNGKVTNSSVPSTYVSIGEARNLGNGVYCFERCTFMSSTDCVLFYGRAPWASGTGKADNGSLITTFPTPALPSGTSVTQLLYPSSLTFTHESIASQDDVLADAQSLADYLSEIANAEGWRTSTGQLKSLYQNFIGQSSAGIMLLCGSASAVRGHALYLRDNLPTTPETSAIVEAIKDKIGNGPTTGTSYPQNHGLPDGAAVLRWSVADNKFQPLLQRSTIADINPIGHFVYPAELYYFANSGLSTSRDSIGASELASDEEGKWKESVLERYKEGNHVTPDTRSALVTSPITYGVAYLKTVLAPVGTPTLSDGHRNASTGEADPQYIPLTNNVTGKPSFPLTGLIISGQRKADFQFLPLEGSDQPEFYVYDSKVDSMKLSETLSGTTYTLLLQSPTNLKVSVALEFRNDSGRSFYGKDGIVYDGATFYLMGVLDPSVADKNGRTSTQVFTRSEYTTINVKVSSLASAYNVMPSLLEPRLELGIVLNPLWDVIHPTDTELY